jgi:hypothetical protein
MYHGVPCVDSGYGEEGIELGDHIRVETVSWQDQFVEDWVGMEMLLALRICKAGQI